jgi:hypothetical protein
MINAVGTPIHHALSSHGNPKDLPGAPGPVFGVIEAVGDLVDDAGKTVASENRQRFLNATTTTVRRTV